MISPLDVCLVRKIRSVNDVTHSPKQAVLGAGIIPFRIHGSRARVLLLHNTNTSIWEPPKGIVEPGEGILSTAIRECFEEAGLSISTLEDLRAPYILNYTSSLNEAKSICLFPWRSESQDTPCPRLSEEHDAAIWLSPEEYDRYNIPSGMRAILEKVVTDAEEELTFRDTALALHSTLMHQINSALCSDSSLQRYDWWLAGSLASMEHTVALGAMLSDVDLVAIGDEPASAASLQALATPLNHAISMVGTHSIQDVGFCFVRPGAMLPRRRAFWSYFENSGIPLVRPHTRPFGFSSSTDSIESESYQLFRLLWYTLLPARMSDGPAASYRFIKGLVTLSLIMDAKPFTGYCSMRRGMLQQLMTSHARLNTSTGTVLAALDAKLGYRSWAKDTGWKGRFFQAASANISARSFFGDDQDLGILCEYLLALGSGAYAENRTIGPMLEIHLGSEGHRIWLEATEDGNTQLIWWLLLIYRILRWPLSIRFSRHKYAQYLRQYAPMPSPDNLGAVMRQVELILHPHSQATGDQESSS